MFPPFSIPSAGKRICGERRRKTHGRGSSVQKTRIPRRGEAVPGVRHSIKVDIGRKMW